MRMKSFLHSKPMTFFLVLFVLWLALLSALWILLLWRRHMRIPEYADFHWGHDFKNECLFREISRPAKLIIDHVSTPKYVLEITLTATDEGTLLGWRQRFETPEMRDKIAKFAGKANEENLDRLASALAGNT